MSQDEPKGKTYILREIPPELWRQVKSKAALEGKPLRALFLGWLASYSADRISLPTVDEWEPCAVCGGDIRIAAPRCHHCGAVRRKPVTEKREE